MRMIGFLFIYIYIWKRLWWMGVFFKKNSYSMLREEEERKGSLKVDATTCHALLSLIVIIQGKLEMNWLDWLDGGLFVNWSRAFPINKQTIKNQVFTLFIKFSSHNNCSPYHRLIKTSLWYQSSQSALHSTVTPSETWSMSTKHRSAAYPPTVERIDIPG